MALTPVPVALRALLDSVPGPTPVETLPLAQCAWRVLGADIAALRTQPPFANSAMDGYAVRAENLVPGTELRVIGESAAGRSFAGTLSAGEAVRIFTGAPIPEGADTILIQENADPDVRADLERFFSRLVPDGDPLFRHQSEGPDDMPAHVRAALTAVQLSIPVSQGRPVLGTWQGIYVWEHRLRPHRREVALHVMGE